MNCIDCIYCVERHNGLWCDYMNIWLPNENACSFYREDDAEEDQ